MTNCIISYVRRGGALHVLPHGAGAHGEEHLRGLAQRRVRRVSERQYSVLFSILYSILYSMLYSILYSILYYPSSKNSWSAPKRKQDAETASRNAERSSRQVGSFASQDLISFRAVFARIRRLRKSQHWFGSFYNGQSQSLQISAILRKTPHRNSADKLQNPGSHKIVCRQVGFNAGHSAAVFLNANPEADMYSFDLASADGKLTSFLRPLPL